MIAWAQYHLIAETTLMQTYYSNLIKQWINDAKTIENEVKLLLRQITKNHLNK